MNNFDHHQRTLRLRRANDGRRPRSERDHGERTRERDDYNRVGEVNESVPPVVHGLPGSAFKVPPFNIAALASLATSRAEKVFRTWCTLLGNVDGLAPTREEREASEQLRSAQCNAIRMAIVVADEESASLGKPTPNN